MFPFPRFSRAKSINMASILNELQAMPKLDARTAADYQQSVVTPAAEAPSKEERKKSYFVTTIPNMATVPPSTTTIEAALCSTDGFGRFQFKFENKFKETPYAVYTPFGFFEFKIPIPGFTISKIDLRFFTITFPLPRLDWCTIDIPVMVFLSDVDKEYIEFFNVAGKSTICYIALGEPA